MMVMVIDLISNSVDLKKSLIKIGKLISICVVFIPIITYALSVDTLENSIQLDKSVRVGHLPNGFTYYLKPVGNSNKINLNFYVKVGFLNENLQEKDYAHLVEHLAGREGYLKAYVEDNLPSKNLATMSSATATNVYSSYSSSIFSKDTESLNNRLGWFYSIATLSVEDSIIVQESRCVRQELFARARGLAVERVVNESVYKTAIFFDGCGESPYSSWLSTYDMGGVSVSSVREFYRQWYRPDRMGLVITGNIQDPEKLEQYLISLYSKIPKSSVKLKGFDLHQSYLSASKRFKNIERKEINRLNNWDKEHSEISLFFRVKQFDKKLDSKAKWLNKQLYKSMYYMIYRRLKSKIVPSWPTQKGTIIDLQVPDRNHPYLRLPVIESKQGIERENIQRVASILQQLQKNGFTQQEWDERKQGILNRISSNDTCSTAYWQDQLKNHFVYEEILPAHKKAITKQWIKSLSLDDINSYLKENFSVMPDDIYITASAGHPALSFTEKQVRGWINDAIKQPIKLKEATDITDLVPVDKKNTALMDPKKVEELNEKSYKELGIDPVTDLDVLEFDNGVKVMLDCQEPSSNDSEMVSIIGTSQRGASYFPADYYYSAISAPEIVKQNGAGGLSRRAIRNKLAGEFHLNAEPVQINIKHNKSTVSTRAKIEDIESYLQLVYLYFTSTKMDPLAFARWQTQVRKRYFSESSPVDPRTDLKNAIAEFLNFRAFGASSNQISTEQFYQKKNVELEKAMKCYQTIFGNSSNFTFIIKGNYEKERILPLLQKYLGNLPSNNTAICQFGDSINKRKIELPNGPIYKSFYADKMNTAYKLYTVPYIISYIAPIPEDNWKDRVTMDIINTYLGPKINQELRFIKGASIYSGTVEGYYSKEDSLYNLTIFVDAIDDELGWIRNEIKNIVTVLKDNGIDIGEKNKVLENPLFFGRYTSSPKFQEKVMLYAHSLSSQDIIKVAEKYFKEIYQYEFAFRECKVNSIQP